MSGNDMRKMAAFTLAEVDRLDAGLRDDKAITESRDLLHGLIDHSDAPKLRLFLGVVRLMAEAVLRKLTDSP
jgi:hypothetical protein